MNSSPRVTKTDNHSIHSIDKNDWLNHEFVIKLSIVRVSIFLTYYSKPFRAEARRLQW